MNQQHRFLSISKLILVKTFTVWYFDFDDMCKARVNVEENRVIRIKQNNKYKNKVDYNIMQ